MNRRTTVAYLVSAGLVTVTGAGTVVATAVATPSHPVPPAKTQHPATARIKVP